MSIRFTNLGVEIASGEGDQKRLEPSPDADQDHPRKHYIYAHVDGRGEIFYIGKGSGRRAWSTKRRHSLWHRYVDKHLDGKYSVRILQDNLSLEETEQLESDWIYQHRDRLVNWISPVRVLDLEAFERCQQLRNANQLLIQQAKALEKDDMERATTMYIQAIEAIAGYPSIRTEKGFVIELLEEETAEVGPWGDVEVLNRLTMCLIKLGRPEDAARHAQSYFDRYKGDLQRAAAKRIFARIEKALAR
jgi:hypothetical protein